MRDRVLLRFVLAAFDSFWLQGMMGGTKSQYDCIKQFSEIDYTGDLRKMTIPTLVLHGDADQIVPIADSAERSVKLLPCEADREPAPIDLPAATTARARALLTDLRDATIDRTQFDPQMNTLLTDETLGSGADFIRPFGQPLAFTPVELRTTAEGNAAIFRVRFATKTLTWMVRIGPDGTINGFDLRHSARNHVYQVVTRLMDGY